MNWEDFPPLSTQPIGVQGDGAVVMLHPITAPGQLVTLAGGSGGEQPTVTLGEPEVFDAGDPLPAGQWLFAVGSPTITASDGTTPAPATGDAWPISVA